MSPEVEAISIEAIVPATFAGFWHSGTPNMQLMCLDARCRNAWQLMCTNSEIRAPLVLRLMWGLMEP